VRRGAAGGGRAGPEPPCAAGSLPTAPQACSPLPPAVAGRGCRRLHLFETQRWRWAAWTLEAGAGEAGALPLRLPLPGRTRAGLSRACVLSAAWGPWRGAASPPVLLLLLSEPCSARGRSAAAADPGPESQQLVALHLVEPAPGLGAQLLPVPLPGLAMGGAAGGEDGG
jgi:hypothetical protein